MCELFGFSAGKKEDISLQLREFFSHSRDNPHGFGLMCSGQLYKEAARASDSERLSEMINSLEPQRVSLAHIRFATVGSVREENCHPFMGADITGREWTLIHNGTIYSGSRLVNGIYTQKGDTDSERLFIYMIDKLNKAQANGELCARERFKLIDEIVIELSPRNKLNLIIYDGEVMYVHKNMRDTLSLRRLGSGTMFATKPLDDEDWEDAPLSQLVGYIDGEHIFTGLKHGAVFEPALSHITENMAMNI
ncbi:MAG: class II glutamine amidotransferase [Ruminococcus sp.]|nr:class II glutamine amidotransferase [Ruminococcus sp.]